MADREQTEPSGAAESPETTLGNRPAAGARLSDRAGPLPSAFGGGIEATDFLGLSNELSGLGGVVPESPADPGPLPTETPAVEDEPSASWLLSLDDPEQGAEAGVEEVAASEEQGPPVRRVFGLGSIAAAALIIGAAIVVAWKLGPSLRGSSATPQPEALVHAPPAKRVHGPSDLEVPGKSPGTGRGSLAPGADPSSEPEPAPQTSGSEPEIASAPPDATPTDPGAGQVPLAGADPELVAAPSTPRPGAERLAEWMSDRGFMRGPFGSADAGELDALADPGPRGSVPALVALSTGPSGGSPPAHPYETARGETARGSGEETSAELVGASREALAPKRSTTGRTPASAPLGPLRIASAEDLKGIWEGTEIPLDALDAETRLLTPAVGAVRVVFKSGEIFEGRLVAIGQGQVWLETGLGRLALSGQRVANIDATSGEAEGKSLEALPRMRVRTPGGLFFGKVVARTENRVTLVTEDGARITLESRDVEAAPLGETRVIGRVTP